MSFLRCCRSIPALVVVLTTLAISTMAFAHGVHGDHVRSFAAGGVLDYVALGAIHMLTGYDHLLFLFGVMFFLTGFWDIVKFITAFTLGHSITLIAATLLGITANAYLVDAVIALSVIYKGFDNLDGFRRWIGIEPPHLLAIVFAFGLVHGFGLSTRLQELGLPESGLVTRLIGFNVGVELGQIAALVIMVAVLAALRRTTAFQPFSKVANGLLVAAGVVLFVHQLHGYQHTTYPDDFGFSSLNHFVEHSEVGNDFTIEERSLMDTRIESDAEKRAGSNPN